MLAIRLQRTGRKGHAHFRLVVQDSHRSPKSGKVVAQLGSFDPHTKAISLDKEKAAFYMEHGARPSERVVSILQKEDVKLPKWITPAVKKDGQTRHAEKLRKNQPAKPVEEVAEPVVAKEEAQVETETAEVEAKAPDAEAATEEVAAEVEESPSEDAEVEKA